MIVPLGKTIARVPFTTISAGGQAVNPDSTPTIVNVQKNGSDANESAVTVQQMQDNIPSNIVGRFRLNVNLGSSGLNAVANDDIAISFEAVIDGTTVTQLAQLQVVSFASQVPSIEIG